MNNHICGENLDSEELLMHSGKRLIAMWAIKRSGNHMLRNWLEYQFPRPTDNWMNCAIDFHHAHHDSWAEYVNCRVVGLEEFDLGTLNIISTRFYEKHNKIVLLRDPYNLFASRIKYFGMLYRGKMDNFRAFVAHRWVEYAKYFLDPDPNVICVSYNKFVSSKDYRKELSEKIDGEFDDAAINVVSEANNGSSFDGLDHAYDAQNMDVFNRWKVYKDNEYYRNLFTDEIKELSDQIFNFNPLG